MPVFSIWMSFEDAMSASVAKNPDKPFLRHSETSLSYSQVESLTSSLAFSLEKMGVKKGDRVGVLMPNSAEHILTLLACARIGAIQVPLNHEYQAESIARTLDMIGARLLIADIQYKPLWSKALSIASSTPIVIPSDVDRIGQGNAGVETPDFNSLLNENGQLNWTPVDLADPLILILTSGTTGAAKAVEISHGFALHLASEVVWHQEYTPEDVLFSPYPLFHGDAPLLTVLAGLVAGCTVAVSRKFSASQFWDEVRYYGATVFDYMGAVLAILGKQPVRESDRDHRVRLAWGGPAPANWKELERRFGFRIREAYGATECCLPVWENTRTERVQGTAGQLCEHHEIRIVDERGLPVVTGEVGEILVRSTVPYGQMTQYYGNPEATVSAWQDLWYHTGDRGSLDDKGYLRFAGRIKDVIRRRGRNIGAEEVEQVALKLDDVVDAAAIAVPSELTEDDIKLVIQSSLSFDPEETLNKLAQSMPRYMVPRYIEVRQDLPRTPTGKVDKKVLRTNWVTKETWDRDSAAWLDTKVALNAANSTGSQLS